MKAYGDVFGTAWLALDLIGARQHFFDEGNAFFNCEACAACVLNVEHLERIAFTQTAVGKPSVELIGFASQADHHHAPEVGMCGIAS